MGEFTAVFTASARDDSGEIGIEALLRHVSGVVDKIERFKAQRQAKGAPRRRAHLTVIHSDKRLPKHRTA